MTEKQTKKKQSTLAKKGQSVKHTGGRKGLADIPHSSFHFTFLSPSWEAGGCLLGGSVGSEPDALSPGTAFRGEGPPGLLGGPSADPLSPPSGELR